MTYRKSMAAGFLILTLIGFMRPAGAGAATVKDKFYMAEKAYQRLLGSPEKQKYRDQWLRCIEGFQEIYRQDPAGPWAPASLFRSGELYLGMFGRSFLKSDQQEAYDLFERITKRFPQSRYRKKAQEILQGRAAPPSQPVKSVPVPPEPARTERPVEPKETGPARDGGAPATGGSATQDPLPATEGRTEGKRVRVEGLRFWSNPNYTRVVIDADGEATFSHRLLKKDPSIDKPQRLYVDLNGAFLGKGREKVVPINDNLLIDARAGQFTLDTVRVVVDIKSFETYKVFSLKNPFRIVIDMWGTAPKEGAAPEPVITEKGSKPGPRALARQLALGVRRIVIDPGHGGRDFGAPGYLPGVHEKDVTLSVAKRLAKKIQAKLGCEVIMTRNRDEYLTLEERTAMANTRNADLFISIHTNAARDSRAYGIETYFLNLATDNDAILVAARENATSTKNISDLQTILNDLMQHAKINESSRLACLVQESLHDGLKDKYSNIKNKGVKQAPFYVLLGAQMPAILVETSFISNSRECGRLTDARYQDDLCEAIVQGLRRYVREINPAAFLEKAPKPDKS